MRPRSLSCLAVAACFAASAAAAGPLRLNDLFQDHMVLPRHHAVISGDAMPGEAVTASFNAAAATVTASADGRFRLVLPEIAAGESGTLTVSAASGSRTLADVVAGDVFLCSGQSNMQVPVTRSLNYDVVIANSANDALRGFNVPIRTGLTPQARLADPASWQKAGPDTTANFSATCYYFAAALHDRIHVPVGFVNASVGGSNITTWLDDASLAAFPRYDADVALRRAAAKDLVAAGQAMGARYQAWWQSSGGQPAAPWAVAAADLDSWPKVPDPHGNWEKWGVADLAGYDGSVWFATHVRLTEAQAARDAELALGHVDDIDYTWVNGKAVGYTDGNAVPHGYHLPAGALKAGDNVIVVNVIDVWSTGGMYGDAPPQLQLADGDTVPLGDWVYHTVPLAQKKPPRAPWDATAGVGVLHNAMVAPLGDFSFAGAVWYQGESNIGDPDYRAELTALMRQWRGQFGPDLPVAVVQLANFNARLPHPAESPWAELREAERLAVLDDPHATLATAVDLGEPTDIHPANKKTLGERLARAMAVRAYGVSGISESGPQIDTVRRDGRSDDLILGFSGLEGNFIAYGADHPIGFEICGHDGCRYADAEIHGREIVLKNVAAAEKVRFCWADAPTCTLYDGTSGLPALPFEREITAQ